MFPTTSPSVWLAASASTTAPELHNADLPAWLLSLAWISLALGVASALFIAFDVWRRPQPMKVMNVVWPIDGLWGSVAWVAAYLWWGRAPLKEPVPDRATSVEAPDPQKAETVAAHAAGRAGIPLAPMSGKASAAKPGAMNMAGMNMGGMKMHPALGISGKPHSMPVSVFIGTSHCGAGCSTADLIVEWALFLAPSVAVVGGLGWVFSNELFAGWVISYVVALAIGIGFQYAAIAPMNRRRGVPGNIWAAAKADVLSLSAWQIGMYGGMAIGQLWVFPTFLGAPVATDTPVFWFMMQIAMLFGFVTAYPVNWFLIHEGIKERM